MPIVSETFLREETRANSGAESKSHSGIGLLTISGCRKLALSIGTLDA